MGLDNAKKFTDADLKRWADAQVLAYLDLIDWARNSKQKLPEHMIGSWLFPDSLVDTTEKVRKVTKRLARRLMHETSIESLFQQAE